MNSCGFELRVGLPWLVCVAATCCVQTSPQLKLCIVRSDSAIARQSLLRELSLRYVFHRPTFRPLQRATTTVKIKAESEGLGGLICSRSAGHSQLQTVFHENAGGALGTATSVSLASDVMAHEPSQVWEKRPESIPVVIPATQLSSFNQNWLRLPHLTNKNCQQWRPLENEHEPVKTIQPF